MSAFGARFCACTSACTSAGARTSGPLDLHLFLLHHARALVRFSNQFNYQKKYSVHVQVQATQKSKFKLHVHSTCYTMYMQAYSQSPQSCRSILL